MNATNPEPRIVHVVEQPTAVVHERIPMAALSDFFGRAFATVIWEYYLSDPETEPDPTKWQTRVVWSVA